MPGGLALAMTLAAASGALDLAKLERGATVSGFRAEAVYLDDGDRPFGGRFVHRQSGFVLDALLLETAPQAFLWVDSFPDSDRGEPHTQEHLLLGKGNRGRAVAGLTTMSLASSSAFTEQWRTSYHFHTAAGPEAFYQLLEKQTDALLHPDYTDEEIRREVRNVGVAQGEGGALRLEEKGTVYNEMVSSSTQPLRVLYRAVQDAAYGPGHPLSFDSGGEPAAIRQMTPEHIRAFHARAYQLQNMGMVAAFPREMPLHDALARLDAMLVRLDVGKRTTRATAADLPEPRPAAASSVEVVRFPHQNEAQPGLIGLVWPANRKLDAADTLLFQLFLQNLAGDATTDLYKLFIDGTTRKLDVGARSVFSWTFENDQGQPFVIGLEDVAAAHLNEATARDVRERVLGEIVRIASLPDGSPELAAFQGRLHSRVVELRRGLAKFVNSPPGFGFRGTSAGWMWHLYQLGWSGEFRRSVTLKPELAAVEALLAAQHNPWREKLTAWKVLGEPPAAIVVRADPGLVVRDNREREERLAAELAKLRERFATADDQQAIRRYQEGYERESARLEAAASAELPHFVEKPPLSLDDALDHELTRLDGVPVLRARFPGMTSATVGLALRLDAVADADLPLLSLLPELLTEVGVIEDGKPVSHEQVSERLRNEVLRLDAGFDADFRTHRAELLVHGAGNDLTEARRALRWMRLVLTSPDWRSENLPRLRDVVDQAMAGLRSRMQRPEESWVNDPAEAWRHQDDPVLLATQSFLTEAHNAQRLRWLLRDAGPDSEAIAGFLDALGTARGSRDELRGLLTALVGSTGEVATGLRPLQERFTALPAGAREHAVQAAKDLDAALADLPESSLAADWAYLCRQIRRDLLTPPAQTLARLNALRESLLRAGSARMFVVGSPETQTALDLTPVRSALAAGSAPPAARSKQALVSQRVLGRDPVAKDPLFVGLLAPALRGGVMINSAPGPGYGDAGREALLDYLSTRLYSGYGAHGIFMKTWGAGLAYSNGFRGGAASATMGYYAERTPDLPQTLSFVIDTLKGARRDPRLAEYAIAAAFGGSRAASGYEARAEAMAEDLTDGWTSEVVRRWRQALLALRSDPGLADALFARLLPVCGRVLPGLGPKARDVKGATFFVIGPEKQLASYEEYLRKAEGDATRLVRLYPRDFWMVE